MAKPKLCIWKIFGLCTASLELGVSQNMASGTYGLRYSPNIELFQIHIGSFEYFIFAVQSTAKVHLDTGQTSLRTKSDFISQPHYKRSKNFLKASLNLKLTQELLVNSDKLYSLC